MSKREQRAALAQALSDARQAGLDERDVAEAMIAVGGGLAALVARRIRGYERRERARTRQAEARQRIYRAPLSLMCQGCGESFTSWRRDAQYCTGRCRQRSYRRRQTAAKIRG